MFSLTDFYSLGYIFAAMVPALLIGRFYVFRTIFQRFMLFLLTLLAMISLVALACWVLEVKSLPLYNVLGFFVFIVAFLARGNKNAVNQKLKFMDKTDAIALITAIIPIAIILISYGSSADHSAALFQLASEGWDNGSHILMIQDVSREKSYIYGPHDEFKGIKTIQESSAYPQAWHLITADFTNGFGGNRFDPKYPIANIAAYMIASLSWMIISCYFFTLAALRFYTYLQRKESYRASEVVSIVSVSLMIHMIVVYGSLASGFTNYIGSIVYILLLASLVIELFKKRSGELYVLAVLFGVVSTLIWFLVFPPIALTVLALLLVRGKSKLDGILKSIKDWRFTAFTIIGVAAMTLQIYIFQAFSSTGGSSQLNAGVVIDAFQAVDGVFPVNQILYAVIVGAPLLLFFAKKRPHFAEKLAFIIIVPWLILSLGLFVYQNITVGYNSYYLSKVLGLSLITAGVVFGAIFTKWITSVSDKRTVFFSIIAPPLILATLVVGTGQSTYGLNKLFQGNTRKTYETAAEIVPLLDSTVSGENYIVVLRNRELKNGSREDNHGKLEIRVVHQPLNCTYRIISGKASLRKELSRLSSCADKLRKQNKTITVITSDSTKNKVLALKKKNILVRNVP